MQSLHRWLLLAGVCLASWLIPGQAHGQHLFQPSHFTVIPHKHTGYSPLHYWAPLLWNAKAYHRGYHHALGQDYQYPHYQSEFPAVPLRGVEPHPIQPIPEQLPLPESAR
jgi:hypothetical protein